jgi:phenylacetic acid degradation protein PaaD
MPDRPADPPRGSAPEFLHNDYCAEALGIRFAESAPGRATATMTVRPDMLNGHGSCHGGIIFTLADSVFALASNSRGRRAVAQFCSIAYLRPAAMGEELKAVGLESILSGQRGIYDITVCRGDEVIAAFRGHARAVDERVDRNDPAPAPG